MTEPQHGTKVLAAACAGFVVVPNLGALLGRGEQTDRYDTVVTPPDYAFAVWAPIFAACAVDTARRWRRAGDHPESDAATAGPLAVAYALNTAWSVAAQADRFGLTPVLLPSAAASVGVAYGRLQRVARPRPSTVLASGLLLGWTSLASAVNVAADVVRRDSRPGSPAPVAAAVAGVATVASALAVVTARSRAGALPLAVAAGWGLATTAADPRRPAGTRLLSGAATAALVTAYASRRHSR